MEKVARVLVTGPRDYKDYPNVARALGITISELVEEGYGTIIVVHGDAPGADSMAKEFTNIVGPSLRARGIVVRQEPHPARWSEHTSECHHPSRADGKCPAAGPRRNKLMVGLGANVCIYFDGPCTRPYCKLPKPHSSHGASGCAKLAKQAGIEVKPY